MISNKHKAYIRLFGAHDQVESIINIFDIGVLSTFTEGISNSIMEYMALSKPVVATEGGGTKELVVNGETGILIPPKSPAILAEKINYLLRSPQLLESMGTKGKKRIENLFNIKQMGESFEAIFNKIYKFR